MNLTYRVTRSLHQEHEATLNLIGKLEALLSRTQDGDAPDFADPLVSDVLTGLRIALDVELEAHFALEEKELFPRLAAVGEGEIVELLMEEHKEILPIRQELAVVVGRIQASGFSDDTWTNFRRLGGELAERLTDHVEKEEMGLIPALEDILSPEDDLQLSDSYALQP